MDLGTLLVRRATWRFFLELGFGLETFTFGIFAEMSDLVNN